MKKNNALKNLFLARRRFLTFCYRSMNPLIISEEVKQALNDKSAPVVSLESTIITHGLPFPQNLEMALLVEKTIREQGGIPATCAFLGGIPHVGLLTDQIEQLANEAKKSKVNKVSRRDIGVSMARKESGGTTIALTMILSSMAGIDVFATGGLGGVHKDGHLTFDVSADLTELGRTPVSVVCSGPKAILDIKLTLEYLETQGVLVSTYNDDLRSNVEVPGFYCRNSGVVSPYSFNSFSEAALIILQSKQMNLKSGNLFCIPPPRDVALPSDFITGIIDEANQKAKEANVLGKELTPFMLKLIAEKTNGESVKCNIKFVHENAIAATKIALNLLHQESESTKMSDGYPIENFKAESSKHSVTSENSNKNRPNTLVIGSVALDSIARINSDKTVSKNSNPSNIKSSIGGVGYNVFLASKYSLQSLNTSQDIKNTSDTELVSLVANDMAGNLIFSVLKEKYNSQGIKKVNANDLSTAQYLAIHDNGGDLVLASADMKIVELRAFLDHMKHWLFESHNDSIVLDCNLSTDAMNVVAENVRESKKQKLMIVEPTSPAKSRKISELAKENLQVFPHNTLSMITPTATELSSIHESFDEKGYFNDFSGWFPVLDSLGINSQFRETLNSLSRSKHNVLKEALEMGYLQQAFQLIPYMPHILIKLGEKGILLVSLSTNVTSYASIPTASKYAPEFTLHSSGNKYSSSTTDEQKQMGVVIQYFPIPEANKDLQIENSTGAGDSFLGFLTASLLVADQFIPEGKLLASEISCVEQEWFKWETIYKAQLASGLSLQSTSAVSESIAHIK